MSKHRHEIAKCLVISTEHLDEKTNARMLEADRNGMALGAARFASYPYGYIIFYFHSADVCRLPKCLIDIRNEMIRRKCDWVRLDSDADQSPNLPTYDW